MSIVLVACGARTELHDSVDASEPIDASIDTRPHDAAHDVTPDAPIIIGDGGACTLGPNLGLPLGDCSGDQVDWFATPYTPPTSITVDRVEAYMMQGNVALLTSSGGAPDAVLFVGDVGSSSPKAWIGADVSPPVFLQGGTEYFIGFQGDCSFTMGGSEPVEYMAPAVSGPWHDQGTDNWTARLIGTCP